MVTVSIGRRISLAVAGGASLGALFYWIGELVMVAIPTAPGTTSIVLATIGVASAATIALSADLEAAAKESPPEES